MRTTLWALAWFCVSAGPALAELAKAPPAFPLEGQRAIPVDFLSVSVEYEFDVEKKTARATSYVEFTTDDTGLPFFDLVPNADRLLLDGRELPAATLKLVSPPGNVTKFRALMVPLTGRHRLEIGFTLPAKEVTFTPGGVGFGYFMSDLETDREFLEPYAPTNFEFDPFRLHVRLHITGARNPHRLFANGRVVDLGNHSWLVDYPDYFTSSSFFLHVTDRPITVVESLLPSEFRSIPVTFYSEKASEAKEALKDATKIFTELEKTYGAFPHDRFVAYIVGETGGMEHCGAAVTSLWSLGHEITHSWFGRGVMPADGNAGWIDEAAATWRDNDYPTHPPTGDRPPENLGGHSPYRRTTPEASYEKGSLLFAELDKMIAGGLKPVLRAFFERHRNTTITTPEFLSFVEAKSNHDFKSYFGRYVFGKSSARATRGLPTRHPGPLTRELKERIR